MKTVSLFIIALFVLLLRCPAFCSTPRHPGVTGVGDNPQEGTVSTQQTEAQSIQELIQNAKGNLATEKKWELDPLSRPKFNLIPAADIGKYRYTDRYLFDLDDAEISHYLSCKKTMCFEISMADLIRFLLVLFGMGLQYLKFGALLDWRWVIRATIRP